MKCVYLTTFALLVISLPVARCQFDFNKAVKDVEKSSGGAVKEAEKSVDELLGKPKPLTNDEVIRGLKEALSVGTNNSTGLASKLDGFNGNQLIKIPFPPEAERVKKTVEDLGMKDKVDKFVLTMNRAAEEASKEAAPIFLNAITDMTISDGFTILRGSDNEATKYLQNKTTDPLRAKFIPIVKNAINKVQVTKYWNPLITTYNKVPGVQKMNPDLDDYITRKALDGLFILITQEEQKIRKDPMARVSELLKRVFGGK